MLPRWGRRGSGSWVWAWGGPVRCPAVLPPEAGPSGGPDAWDRSGTGSCRSGTGSCRRTRSPRRYRVMPWARMAAETARVDHGCRVAARSSPGRRRAAGYR
ncbi:hypothetical protein SXIM_48530 [Streptomyces xiamenensis]|uniref:Uncharacterized protein n=1 Tax=Streptomyces xiamenensis TaxID=408015 RepID=A0A0F7FZF4_9ACTN|nr:hypothetical protein SXIM_48530 [Streptomyces xiamenensis]